MHTHRGTQGRPIWKYSWERNLRSCGTASHERSRLKSWLAQVYFVVVFSSTPPALYPVEWYPEQVFWDRKWGMFSLWVIWEEGGLAELAAVWDRRSTVSQFPRNTDEMAPGEEVLERWGIFSATRLWKETRCLWIAVQGKGKTAGTVKT